MSVMQLIGNIAKGRDAEAESRDAPIDDVLEDTSGIKVARRFATSKCA